MGGLAIFTLIGLYIFAGYKFVKTIKPGYRKWLAIAALVLIPTADSIVGRIYLQHLCATEGGLKVYRVAQGVDGFINLGGDDITEVEKYGYKFSESTPVNGLVNRYSNQDGKIVKETKVIPQSKYRVRYSTNGQKDTYMRSVLVVETVPEGEVVAKDVQIGFTGGWAERILEGFSDAGASVFWCGYRDLNVRYREIILNTLRGSKGAGVEFFSQKHARIDLN